MRNIEQSNCSFCGELKPVLRKYIHPANRFKNGKEFNNPVIIYYCNDCGIDEPVKEEFPKPSVGSPRFTAGVLERSNNES